MGKYLLLILLLCLFSQTNGQSFNSIRIANSPDNPPSDSFLKRAQLAGYTHILVQFAIPNAAEWVNGVCVGNSTLQQSLFDVFQKVHSYQMKMIPFVSCGNRQNGWWKYTNNPVIVCEPLNREDQQASVIKGVLDPWNVHLPPPIPQIIASGIADMISTQTSENTNVPEFAHRPEGLSKTFKSYVSVIALAYQRFQSQTGVTEDLEYIHIGYDESMCYDQNVSYENKLLIGRTAYDIQYIYDNAPNHGGVHLDSVDINFCRRDALNGIIDTNCIPQYQTFNSYPDSNGLAWLLADAIAHRTEEIKQILPNTQALVFADMMDPKFLGGYFHLSKTVGYLHDRQVSFNNGTSIVTEPLNQHLLLMPWMYKSTFNEPVTGSVGSVELKESLQNVIGHVFYGAGCLAGCGFIPFPGLYAACLTACATTIVLQTSIPDHIDINMSFSSASKFYDPKPMFDTCIANGFRSMYIWGYEMGYAHLYTQSINTLYNYIDAVNSYPVAIRNQYFPGFMAAHWTDDGTKWSDTISNPYEQPVTFNAMELMATASAGQRHSLATGMSNSLFMGGLSVIPGDSTHPAFFVENTPVSKLDFFTKTRDFANAGRLVIDTASEWNISFFDALYFCNQLSLQEGKEPVYDLSSASFTPITTLPLSSNENFLRRRMVENVINNICDYSKDGYRVPTRSEWERAYLANSGNGYSTSNFEWATNIQNNLVDDAFAMRTPTDMQHFGNFGLRLVCNLPNNVTITGGIPKRRSAIASNTVTISNLTLDGSDGPAEYKAGHTIVINPETVFDRGSRVQVVADRTLQPVP